jgi:hypothetical protein
MNGMRFSDFLRIDLLDEKVIPPQRVPSKKKRDAGFQHPSLS